MTVTKTEEFILALVEVDGKNTHMVYLRHPFKNPLDFPVTSVNYNIQELLSSSEILLNQ